MSDSRSHRVTEFEAELASKDEKIAAQGRRIAEQAGRIAEQVERIAEQAEEIATLKTQVAELRERLGQDSSNSHKPPSTDAPSNRKKRRAKDAKNRKNQKRRKRGGQEGHKGSQRELLPPEQVDEFVDHFPSHCENCWEALPQVPDPDAKRYQATEIPPIRPRTTEHRRHAVICGCCGYKTRATYDEEEIPSSPFGPRLMALIAMLTGVYHLSRRKARQLLSDVLGVSVSLGAISNVEARVSEAVKPAVAEAWNEVGEGEVKHTDGTSWYQAGKPMALWTIATAATTVFKILADGSKATLQALFGGVKGILVSDRAKALNFWAMAARQICWAHLIRKFVSYSERERDGPEGGTKCAEIGRELLDYAGIVFTYWHDYKDGKLTREQLRGWMAPVRQQVEATLVRGVEAELKGLSGSCADILEHKPALWTFVDQDGVEPTNNHGEQQLRAFVLWRKRSFGTQSERGNLFAERLMTVAQTARKQGKDVLAFLVACCDPDTRSASLFEPDLVVAAA